MFAVKNSEQHDIWSQERQQPSRKRKSVHVLFKLVEFEGPEDAVSTKLGNGLVNGRVCETVA